MRQTTAAIIVAVLCAACGNGARASAVIASGNSPRSYTPEALAAARKSLAEHPCVPPRLHWECGILLAQGKGDLSDNWDWIGVTVENDGNIVVIGNSWNGAWNAKALELVLIDGTRLAWDNHDHDETVAFPKEFVQLP